MPIARILRTALLVLAASLACHSGFAVAADPAYAVGMRELRLVDPARTIRGSGTFKGTPDRRIDTLVWYPVQGDPSGEDRGGAPPAKGGRWPLAIYSHGISGKPDEALHIVRHLVRRGYVVAALNYPLASRTAFTQVEHGVVNDVSEQVRDVSFVIDRLLADPALGKVIDPTRIGTLGHSLGAVTSYFASFGMQTRDPRIKATALLGGGDPVTTALWQDMGLDRTGHSAVSVPVLFLSAEKDIFTRTNGRPYAAFSRVEPPKYEIMIERGTHVWFYDGKPRPADNRNPDCLFFDRPGAESRMPGCEERTPLIDPERQQEITRTALLAFFDAYLKGDAAAKASLKDIGKQFDEVDLRYEE